MGVSMGDLVSRGVDLSTLTSDGKGGGGVEDILAVLLSKDEGDACGTAQKSLKEMSKSVRKKCLDGDSSEGRRQDKQICREEMPRCRDVEQRWRRRKPRNWQGKLHKSSLLMGYLILGELGGWDISNIFHLQRSCLNLETFFSLSGSPARTSTLIRVRSIPIAPPPSSSPFTIHQFDISRPTGGHHIQKALLAYNSLTASESSAVPLWSRVSGIRKSGSSSVPPTS